MKSWQSLALLALAGAISSIPAHAQVTTANLLTNPGAETGSLTGWAVGGTSNPSVDNGSFDAGINPHTGSYDFYGGNGISGTLTQNVALVGSQGITAALIDSGGATANVMFWEQGLNQGTPSDDAFVSLTFRNAAGDALGTASTAEVDSHQGVWQPAQASFAIPAGARSIDYAMQFVRHSGADLDGFVDDNSLTVTSTPEPSQNAALALGALGVGLLAVKARRGRAAA